MSSVDPLVGRAPSQVAAVGFADEAEVEARILDVIEQALPSSGLASGIRDAIAGGTLRIDFVTDADYQAHFGNGSGHLEFDAGRIVLPMHGSEAISRSAGAIAHEGRLFLDARTPAIVQKLANATDEDRSRLKSDLEVRAHRDGWTVDLQTGVREGKLPSGDAVRKAYEDGSLSEVEPRWIGTMQVGLRDRDLPRTAVADERAVEQQLLAALQATPHGAALGAALVQEWERGRFDIAFVDSDTYLDSSYGGLGHVDAPARRIYLPVALINDPQRAAAVLAHEGSLLLDVIQEPRRREVERRAEKHGTDLRVEAEVRAAQAGWAVGLDVHAVSGDVPSLDDTRRAAQADNLAAIGPQPIGIDPRFEPLMRQLEATPTGAELARLARPLILEGKLHIDEQSPEEIAAAAGHAFAYYSPSTATIVLPNGTRDGGRGALEPFAHELGHALDDLLPDRRAQVDAAAAQNGTSYAVETEVSSYALGWQVGIEAGALNGAVPPPADIRAAHLAGNANSVHPPQAG